MHLLIHSDYTSVEFSSVGCVLTDPPYALTRNSWDGEAALDFIEELWPCLEDDSSIVTTADMKYAAMLLARYSDAFSHDLVWKKTIGSGQMNIKRRPLRLHEHVLVFNKGKGHYNRIKTPGNAYKVRRDIKTEDCYGRQAPNECVNVGERDATTVVEVANPRVRGGHPTQKPLLLFQKMCDIYSDSADVVLDPFCGSVVILDVTNRVSIGVERDAEYYRVAADVRRDRIVEAEPSVRAEFQKYIPNLPNLEYTIFSTKS